MTLTHQIFAAVFFSGFPVVAELKHHLELSKFHFLPTFCINKSLEVSEQTAIIYVHLVVQQPLKFGGLTKISLFFSLILKLLTYLLHGAESFLRS